MKRKPNTTRSGGAFNAATIEAVWQKARRYPGHLGLRIDACGTTIARAEYGKIDSSFGWEVDHIHPVSKGGFDNIENLQPLQWRNNRSKGDDWPDWTCKQAA